jgi:hypothetical protein
MQPSSPARGSTSIAAVAPALAQAQIDAAQKTTFLFVEGRSHTPADEAPTQYRPQLKGDAIHLNA